ARQPQIAPAVVARAEVERAVLARIRALLIDVDGLPVRLRPTPDPDVIRVEVDLRVAAGARVRVVGVRPAQVELVDLPLLRLHPDVRAVGAFDGHHDALPGLATGRCCRATAGHSTGH